MTTTLNNIRPFSVTLNDCNIAVANNIPLLRGCSLVASIIITPIALVETIATLTYAIFTSFVHTLTFGSSKKLQNHVVNVWSHVFHSFTMMGAVGHFFANTKTEKKYLRDLADDCKQLAVKFCEGFNKLAKREVHVLPLDNCNVLHLDNRNVLPLDNCHVLPLDNYKDKILEIVDSAVEKFHTSNDIKECLVAGLKKDSFNESKTGDEILEDFYEDLEGPIETLEYVANLTQYLEIIGPLYCPKDLNITGCQNRQQEILRLKKEIRKLTASQTKLLIENLFSKETSGEIATIAIDVKILASSINISNLLDKQGSIGRFYKRIVDFKNKNIKKLM